MATVAATAEVTKEHRILGPYADRIIVVQIRFSLVQEDVNHVVLVLNQIHQEELV